MNASKNSNAKGSIYSITFFFLIYNIIIIVVYRNDDINGSSGFFLRKGKKSFPKNKI